MTSLLSFLSRLTEGQDESIKKVSWLFFVSGIMHQNPQPEIIDDDPALLSGSVLPSSVHDSRCVGFRVCLTAKPLSTASSNPSRSIGSHSGGSGGCDFGRGILASNSSEPILYPYRPWWRSGSTGGFAEFDVQC